MELSLYKTKIYLKMNSLVPVYGLQFMIAEKNKWILTDG